jgi:uncharacterized Zn finger protein (UPF0148 family)
MIKRVSEFEVRYVGSTKLKKTCDNCYEKAPLAQMSNGTLCCKPCSEDIRALTDRLPPTGDRK